SDHDLLEILCRPGFSTQETADMGAGRGMGMNIVHEMVTGMGGDLRLENHPGQGAGFILQLPLTLTIIEAFIVEVSGERYALPQSMINEVIEVEAENIRPAGRMQLLPYRDGAIPLLSLQARYRLLPSARSRWYGLVVGQQENRAAILVDRVIGIQEAVVRPLSDPLIGEPSISGATELGDGSVALIVDCNELIGQRLAGSRLSEPADRAIQEHA
ncbi:MAG: chemotaxis protein CheW, partial [Chloroflexota bacterium]